MSPSQPLQDLPATIADTAAQLLPVALPYLVGVLVLWLITAGAIRLLRGAS